MQTKAAILFEQQSPLRLLNIEIPMLKKGQVLVQMAYSGLCHSQLNEIIGAKGKDEYLPHTLGHEGSGIVLEIGEGVTKVKPGDYVVLSWIKSSGLDVCSTRYKANGHSINSGPISTFMDKTVISENRIIPIPKKMPLKEAALLGCAIPTGAGIIFNETKLKSGDSIAIFGVGGVGLSAVLAASTTRADIIIAVDKFKHKLEQARQLGATHLVNVDDCNPLDEISKITQGKGVDYSVETAGRRETMEAAFRSVKNGGGLCVVAGNLPKGETIAINPMDLIQGKKINGTWGGATIPDKDIPQYVDWYLSGEMDIGKLITHEYKLDEINNAFDSLIDGKVGRALLNLNN